MYNVEHPSRQFSACMDLHGLTSSNVPLTLASLHERVGAFPGSGDDALDSGKAKAGNREIELQRRRVDPSCGRPMGVSIIWKENGHTTRTWPWRAIKQDVNFRKRILGAGPFSACAGLDADWLRDAEENRNSQ